MRQMGIGKTSASEPLSKCRKGSWHQNRGDKLCPGMSLAGVLFSGQAMSGMKAA
jgi:hypothetical protein